MKDLGYNLGGGAGVFGSITCIYLDSGWHNSFNVFQWIPITVFFCIKVGVASILLAFLGAWLQELIKTDKSKWIGLKREKRQLI